MITYIIGHLKPDTDSVVAAIALEYLFKQQKCFGYANPKAVITEPLNPETTFLFNKYALNVPALIKADQIKTTDRVVLVDHNETAQRLPNLNPAQITEIIDHHQVNLNFNVPIFMTFKPWGSTNTIIYYLMKQQNVKPHQTLAALMLAAILSDTVGFKSTTTTKHDQTLGQELARLAKINDLEAFTLEIFKAKSNLTSLTPEQIVKNDYKIFDFPQKTFISQLETVEQLILLKNKKTALFKAMTKVKEQLAVSLLIVAVTDILKVNTKLLLAGEEESRVAQQAFGGQVINQILDIGPKMSRKKEIAPAIEVVLKK